MCVCLSVSLSDKQPGNADASPPWLWNLVLKYAALHPSVLRSGAGESSPLSARTEERVLRFVLSVSGGRSACAGGNLPACLGTGARRRHGLLDVCGSGLRPPKRPDFRNAGMVFSRAELEDGKRSLASSQKICDALHHAFVCRGGGNLSLAGLGYVRAGPGGVPFVLRWSKEIVS